jgi:hypothetical protein
MKVEKGTYVRRPDGRYATVNLIDGAYVRLLTGNRLGWYRLEDVQRTTAAWLAKRRAERRERRRRDVLRAIGR